MPYDALITQQKQLLKDNLPDVSALQELFATEISFFEGLIKLNDILNHPNVLEEIAKLPNTADQKAINNYQKELVIFLNNFEPLGFLSCLTSPEGENKAINVLNELVKYNNYELYTNKLTELMIQGQLIQQIFSNNAELEKPVRSISRYNATTYMITPLQRLTKYSLLFGEIIKHTTKQNKDGHLEDTLKLLCELENQSKNATKKANKSYALIEDANKEIQASMSNTKGNNQLNILQCIASLDPELEQQTIGIDYNKILTTTYPKIFKLDGIGTVVTKNDLIAQSLGMTDGVIKPNRFNSTKLIKSYEQDKNPLWLVLASRIPINDNFTHEQKIEVYRELVTAYLNGELGAYDESVFKKIKKYQQLQNNEEPNNMEENEEWDEENNDHEYNNEESAWEEARGLILEAKQDKTLNDPLSALNNVMKALNITSDYPQTSVKVKNHID